MCAKSAGETQASKKVALAMAILLLTSSCSAPESSYRSLGPTGSVTKSEMPASYLIPPEIPATLVTLLFSQVRSGSEILAIRVVSANSQFWSLEISSESLPDNSSTQIRHFERNGNSWREIVRL